MKTGDHVKSIIYPYFQYEIVEVLASGCVRVRNRNFDGLVKTISPQILVPDIPDPEEVKAQLELAL